jgi:hypothetical protein
MGRATAAASPLGHYGEKGVSQVDAPALGARIGDRARDVDGRHEHGRGVFVGSAVLVAVTVKVPAYPGAV